TALYGKNSRNSLQSWAASVLLCAITSAGLPTSSIVQAIVAVLPVPVAPTRVWNFSPPRRLSASVAIAVGWSPVGRYASDVLKAGTRSRVASMAVATETRARLESPPYEAYAAIMGTFLGGVGLAGVAAKIFDRNPACQTPLDFAVLSFASFKAARTVARGEVGSFLREPFVEGLAHEGGESPVDTGDFRQALGELVTCSRCGGTWAAAGLAVTQI